MIMAPKIMLSISSHRVSIRIGHRGMRYVLLANEFTVSYPVVLRNKHSLNLFVSLLGYRVATTPYFIL
jgi:hypothetical protein